MLDRHRSQNEAWLRARAEENDRERRELCRLRVSKHIHTPSHELFHSGRSTGAHNDLQENCITEGEAVT